MLKPSLFYSLLLLVLCISCKKDGELVIDKNQEPNINLTDERQYLHLSHTRLAANPNMDGTVESIDYKKYDMLWLGGDLAAETSYDNTTMLHVDSIFDLENQNTLWALGNHDYSNLLLVQAYTHRPKYYSYYKNGITFIVLDTQDSLSNITGAQKVFFNSVVDTLDRSSHLVILHHKLIWMHANPVLENQISSVSNGGFGGCFYCLNPNNFYTDLYPKLVSLETNGIEVLCIGGDIGFIAKEFEYKTPEGIDFLASGISSGELGNKSLLFHHDLKTGKLSWEFKLISSL